MKQWYKNRKKDHFYLKAKKNDLISRAYYKIEEIDKRFHLIFNIAIGGNWGGAKGIDDSIFPSKMEIDYVKVFSKNEKES